MIGFYRSHHPSMGITSLKEIQYDLSELHRLMEQEPVKLTLREEKNEEEIEKISISICFDDV